MFPAVTSLLFLVLFTKRCLLLHTGKQAGLQYTIAVCVIPTFYVTIICFSGVFLNILRDIIKINYNFVFLIILFFIILYKDCNTEI